MASEITELVIEKLRLLYREENYFSSSKTRIHRCVEELKEFQKILKGAEDQETNGNIIEEWNKLVGDIYSLEDFIEPLVYRSNRTTLKYHEIFINEMRLKNKIGKLRRKVRKLLPSNSNDEQIPPQASEDVHIQSTYSDDMQQAPTSSEVGTGIVPVFEYNTPATVTNPEGSPRFGRTDSVSAPLPPRRLLSRNWSDGRLIFEDVDEDAIIPTSSKLDNGIVPISGDNKPAAMTNPEGSPRFRRTDLVGAELSPWRILSRNWSDGQLILQDVDEDAMISDGRILSRNLSDGQLIHQDVDEDAMISDKIWGETGDCLEEKSVKDMQENASEQMHAKRWERLPDIMDEASVIVGLEDKIQELAELVLNNNKLHFLVAVLGVAGSGKTTVVRTFYKSIASKRHFECRAWIRVPQDFEERDILLDLDRQLRKARDNQSLSVELLREGLSLLLTQKRYLIVLDDVRALDIRNALYLVFPNSSNGSRVILTTRKPYLAYDMVPRPVVVSLRPLDEGESWKLFTEKVGTCIDDIPSRLREKILQRCRGVPLTIVLLGGLLSTKNKGQNYTQWFDVIEQTGRRREKKKVVVLAQQVPSYARQKDKKKMAECMTIREDRLTSPDQLALFATKQKEAQSKVVTDNAISAEAQSTSFDDLTCPDELSKTVAVTYQHLSFSSKCCLLYLGQFPRSYDIPLRRLLPLWLAEGLVTQPAGEKGPLEDLAKNCFEELLRTNMVEIAEKRLDGSPKTCRVTSTVYDSLLLNAEKVGFFHSHRSSGTATPPQSNIRRLVEYYMYINTNPAEISIRHLRSYISFYRSAGAPTTGVSKMLNKIIKGGYWVLVVLDLEGVYKPVLPKMLGKLRQLKYLGLRRTYLDSMPESAGGLPLLETLDIKHTGIITPPSTIWVAKKLRNLYMSEIYADVSILKKSAHGALSNLQILWGLIIGREIPETDWLDKLTDLRKLKLTCLEASVEAISGWLSKLSNLQCLKLRAFSDSKKPSRLALGEMKMPINLSRLYLLGQLPQSFKISELPQNLEDLTLSVSHLSEDPMEAIGKLGKLKVLRLYANSFKGQIMTCHKDGFLNLQVLKLWMLEELRNWTVKENAMPVLKELEIRCCKKLRNVDFLEKLTSLKELTLTDMEQFEAVATEKLGRRAKITPNKWTFPPPWDIEEKAEAAP